jgi:integrase
MQANPVKLLEPMHVPTPETPVLTEAEVAGLRNAYRVK